MCILDVGMYYSHPVVYTPFCDPLALFTLLPVGARNARNPAIEDESSKEHYSQGVPLSGKFSSLGCWDK